VEAARLEQAQRLNSWEHMKGHIFVDAFVRVARAYGACFEGGAAAVAGMRSFVDDMEQTRARSEERQVRSSRRQTAGWAATARCGCSALW
jgi:hypothetical protein